MIAKLSEDLGATSICARPAPTPTSASNPARQVPRRDTAGLAKTPKQRHPDAGTPGRPASSLRARAKFRANSTRHKASASHAVLQNAQVDPIDTHRASRNDRRGENQHLQPRL